MRTSVKTAATGGIQYAHHGIVAGSSVGRDQYALTGRPCQRASDGADLTVGKLFVVDRDRARGVEAHHDLRGGLLPGCALGLRKLHGQDGLALERRGHHEEDQQQQDDVDQRGEFDRGGTATRSAATPEHHDRGSGCRRSANRVAWCSISTVRSSTLRSR